MNEKPKSFSSGRQTINTPCGRIIPLNVRQGLAYMDMRPPTDEEMESYPHVTFTSDSPWDPSNLDNELEEDFDYLEGLPPISPEVEDLYDYVFDLNISRCIKEAKRSGEWKLLPKIKVPKSVLPKEPNFQTLRPNFGWLPICRIKDTIKNTTQWYKAEGRLPMRRHYKTRFPAANVSRLNENVATDTFFSDTPAHDDGIPGHGGCTMTQIFTGCTSHLTKAYPMHSEKQMPQTLMKFIKEEGAMNNLVGDNAKVAISHKVQEILDWYCIGQHFSEPEQQNQNPAERRIQDIKRSTNVLMDRTGTPARYWLLCLLFVCYLFNRVAHESLNGQTPILCAHGFVPDISALLFFRWWEPVYFYDDNVSFPSDTKERRGRWVGVAETCGDVLTYMILTDDTEQVVYRSAVRSALSQSDPNLRADLASLGDAFPDAPQRF